MKRGTICVARSVKGQVQVLPLADQQSYQEWQGCFSWVG